MIHLLPIICFPRSLSTKPLLCLFPNIAIRYEQSVSIVLCDTNTGTLRGPARSLPCLSSMTPPAAPSTAEEPLVPRHGGPIVRVNRRERRRWAYTARPASVERSFKVQQKILAHRGDCRGDTQTVTNIRHRRRCQGGVMSVTTKVIMFNNGNDATQVIN